MMVDFAQDNEAWLGLSRQAQQRMEAVVDLQRAERIRAFHDPEYKPRPFSRFSVFPTSGVSPAEAALIDELSTKGMLTRSVVDEFGFDWSDQAVRIMGQLHRVEANG